MQDYSDESNEDEIEYDDKSDEDEVSPKKKARTGPKPPRGGVEAEDEDEEGEDEEMVGGEEVEA